MPNELGSLRRGKCFCLRIEKSGGGCLTVWFWCLMIWCSCLIFGCLGRGARVGLRVPFQGLGRTRIVPGWGWYSLCLGPCVNLKGLLLLPLLRALTLFFCAWAEPGINP